MIPLRRTRRPNNELPREGRGHYATDDHAQDKAPGGDDPEGLGSGKVADGARNNNRAKSVHFAGDFTPDGEGDCGEDGGNLALAKSPHLTFRPLPFQC